MTRFLLLPTLLILLPFSSQMLANDGTAPRTVTTTGQGLVEVKANMADVVMQTATTQKSATEAKREVDKRVNLFLEQLKALGIAQDDIVASTLRIAPEYDYNNRTRLFSGYNASRDIIVTLKDLNKLDSLLETATGTDITFIQQIQLKTRDEAKFKQQAFEQAIADSKAKAEVLAKAYGAELGAIYTINYQNQEPMLMPKAEMASMRLAADSGGGQYLHDSIKFNDQVSVVFELIIPR